MRMKRDDGAHTFVEACLDTPLALPSGLDTSTVERTPGCCVKSREEDAAGWPAHFGKLVTYSEERVVVRSHGWKDEEKCVWVGSAADYHADWECD